MEERFLIKGLGGKKELSGTVSVSGSKNAVLPAIASTVLFNGDVVLKNVPMIEDVKRSVGLLKDLGAKAKQQSSGTCVFDSSRLNSTVLNREISKHLRSSIILTGPVLARYGSVSFPHPGGCVIGKRPIDLFLESYERMGASVKAEEKWYKVSAANGRLKGADIFLKISSVTATETLMMAGVLANGTTILRNASMEPEVIALADFLAGRGAKISGIGTPTITIEGDDILESKGCEYKIIPDRLEAGSYLILGALGASDIKITKCNPKHLHSLINSLRDAGVEIKTTKSTISIGGNKKPNNSFSSFNIKTHEYPGFPTDLQAPAVVFLTQVSGESRVFETIFEGRLQYTQDLVRMGADIELLDSHRAIVRGPRELKAKQLKSPDIRAGLAFVVAAAVARGESVIHDVYYIDRGYERIEKKLSGLGLDIKRVKE